MEDNYYLIGCVVISAEAEIVLIVVRSINFYTLIHILVMFGRNEEEDQ